MQGPISTTLAQSLTAFDLIPGLVGDRSGAGYLFIDRFDGVAVFGEVLNGRFCVIEEVDATSALLEILLGLFDPDEAFDGSADPDIALDGQTVEDCDVFDGRVTFTEELDALYSLTEAFDAVSVLAQPLPARSVTAQAQDGKAVTTEVLDGDVTGERL